MITTPVFSDRAAENAETRDRDYKVWTGISGLQFHVTRRGSKSWRMDFSRNGKRGTFVLGRYPKINFMQAQALLEFARAMLAENRPMEAIRALIQQLDRRYEAVPVRNKKTGKFVLLAQKPETDDLFETVTDLNTLSPDEMDYLAGAMRTEAELTRLREKLSKSQ